MKIVCISDTHGLHDRLKVPDGDILIHSGDISGRGRHYEIVAFSQWFLSLPHKHKILIPGNHDFFFENRNTIVGAAHVKEAVPYPIICLIDEMVEIDGIKIWGSPTTPIFCNWAFMKARGEQLKEHWSKMPENIDILVTHGPPQYILDECASGDKPGCEDLLNRIKEVNPRYHIFGHIHNGHGKQKIGKTTFINASVLNDDYLMVNDPIVFNIKARV